MILSTLLSAKTAAAVIGAGTLVLGGTVAAYAGVLPAGLQTVAHDVVGAPSGPGDDSADSPDASKSPDPSESPDAAQTTAPDPTTSPSPKGPDASGPAAFGLCNAHEHGGLPEHSTAYQALLAAANAAAAAAPAPTAPSTSDPTAGTTTTVPTTDPVQTYCDSVLGITPAPTASATSGASGTTTTHGRANKPSKPKHASHRGAGQSGSH